MISKAVFEQSLSRIKGGSMEIDFWGQEKKVYGEGQPLIGLRFKDPKVVNEIVRKMDLGFGEAYMDERIDVVFGDLDQLLRLVELNSVSFRGILASANQYRYNRNIKRNQREQIHAHYDVGNDFYKLWLDDTMTYTCAYFKTPKDTLEQAQRQKIDHVLRKLQLEPGHEFVDIGCGWGHLVVRAAKLYGAKGRGVTLSRQQYEYAVELAKREGVSDLAQFENINYQDLLPTDKQYDRVISVGILEHVGKGNHRQYFDVVNALLKPGGVSVLHSITHQKEQPVPAFIDKYVFPGGYIPSSREIISLLPEYEFRMIDYENLRVHYDMTLCEWLKRFEEHVDEIRKTYGEKFVRMWRLYLVGSIASFRYGSNDLSQIVFTKGINNNLPLTREFLYKT